MIQVRFAVEVARRKRAVLLLSLGGLAALRFSPLPPNNSLGNGAGAAFDLDVRPVDAEDGWLGRILTKKLPEDYDPDLEVPAWLRGDDDGHLGAATTAAGESKISMTEPLAPYTIEDLVRATFLFSNRMGVMVYAPESDEFEFYYPAGMRWMGCSKLMGVFRNQLPYMLRTTFPERFQGPTSPEMAIAITSGDYLHFHANCLPNFPHTSPECVGSHAPVLQFGSVFKSTEILPNAIAMPMPTDEHIHCFKMWVHHQDKVCAGLKSGHSMVFGEDLGLEWEDLTPQVVWRGTDFGYLNHLNPGLRRPTIETDIDGHVDPHFNKKKQGVRAMKKAYDGFRPRWQGVVLTAEAELEAKEKGTLPWADIKFTGPSGATKKEYLQYDRFEKYGVPAIGDSMSKKEMARYRYQLDIGGGGGTTWSGTIQKLAMPGLLFHHETPTKDYIHDVMRPWIHYVPVRSDLRDLKEKFDWAEGHPEAAKKIADQGTALVRSLGTPEGFGAMFDEVFVGQLQRVMEAYGPVSTNHLGSSWRDVLKNNSVREMKPIAACNGHSVMRGGCRELRE